MKKSDRTKILFLLALLGAAAFLGISQGSVHLSLRQLLSAEHRPILELRLLRVLLALVAGSGLAVSGIALQAVLRNPLAEPYLLGTSSGAGLGAIVAIILGAANIFLPLSAFLGAVSTVALVYLLAKEGRRVAAQSLILCGVVVSVALSGIIVFLVSFFDHKALQSLLWWLWGSLQIYDLKLFGIVSIIVAAGTLCIYALSQDLNAMNLGEEGAIHLGIDIESTKKLLFLATSLITASLVCVCGIIGFVGLIIPHGMRLVIGTNHRTLIPAACLASGIFMIVCDLISRVLLPPFEIPIGVITACVGAPWFIILLKTKHKVT